MDKLESLKKEYELKKDLIKKRLEEFKKFYYSPVSWFFTDNTMTLKEVNTSDDERLFEELCFCILTANASAVMGMRCIDKLRGILLKGTEREIQEKLTGSHIYPNIRAKFIIHTREYLKNEFNFKLKEKLELFKDDESRRDFFATNKGIKGLGYKEASLPYNEKVLILIDKKVKLTEIGILFGDYSSGRYEGKKLETFAFNPKTLKYEVVPITNIFKHNYKKDLYEICLTTGRLVKVTGDHSLFSLMDAKVVPIEVRNLKIGDFIAIPKKIEFSSAQGNELNLIELFTKYKIFKNCYIRSKSYCSYLRKKYGKKIKRENQYTQYFRGIIPLEVLNSISKKAYDSKILKNYNVKIGFGGSNNTINAVLSLTEEFFWVLGILIAEASIGKNPIEFTLGLEERNRHIKLNNYLKKIFGVRVRSYKPKSRKVYLSKTNNKGFFYLINLILKIKGKAKTKKVPEIVFSSNFDNRIAFLQGYWEGDGWKKSKSYLSVSTSSFKLANDLLYLFLMSGTLARLCKKRNRQGKGGISYTIDINNIVRPNQIKYRNLLRKREVIPGIGKLLHNIHKSLGLKSKINNLHTPLYNKIITWKLGINEPTKLNVKKVLEEFYKYKETKETKLIERLIKSDLSFVKIKKIKKIKYNKNYVYDLEVASRGKNFQNFIGGFGGVCLHNSHYLRNIGFSGYSILDKHIINSLYEFGFLDKIDKPNNKKKYLLIEEKLKDFSNKTGIHMDKLDLLLWSRKNGKILK